MSDSPNPAIPILRMSPRLTPRPWGGTRLGSFLGKELSGPDRFGESWELSDHPEGPSTLQGGPYDGELFGDLVRRFPREMVGRTVAPDRYPLLVKYIDAEEGLSIQVHPSDGDARRMGIDDRGKTECWWILDCPPEGEVVLGLRPGTTRANLEKAIEEGEVSEVVRKVPISPGTFLFVPPGTVHAILAGTLLCEIQQSSNVTFRLWDWNRLPARIIHVEEALETIRFEDAAPPDPFRPFDSVSDAPRNRLLTDNPFFTVRAVQLPPHSRVSLTSGGRGLIVNGVEGACRVEDAPLGLGDTLFVPACHRETRLATDTASATLLLTGSNE